VEAAAQGSGPQNEGIIYRRDLAVAESVNTVRDLWARARLGSSDVDALMFYDHCTPFCLLNLEAYAFVPFGEAMDFVEGGQTFGSMGRCPPIPMGATTPRGLTHPQ